MFEALTVIGGFKMVHRGLLDIKGKGLMNTYWLECRDGPVPLVRDEISWFSDMHAVFVSSSN